jgi:nucleotide-binding universal stress UspA family protein
VAEHIIVGINQAAPAQTVLDWALQRADELQVPAVLAHIVYEYPHLYDHGYYERVKDSARVLLEKLTAHAREITPDVPVSTRLLTGSVVEGLSELSNDAGLLVVGTDKTNRFTSEVFSGVGLQLAAVSNCPLAVIPKVGAEAGTGVVAGVDGSAGSRNAVEFAAAEANRTGQALTVVHAYRVPDTWVLEDAASGSIAHEIRQEAEAVLAESIAGISGIYPGLRIHPKVVAEQSPPKAIIAEASSAQMLVVGNRGRGRLKSLLLGSVSHDLLIHTPCPTVVTHDLRRP